MIEEEVDLRPTFRNWGRRWWLIALWGILLAGAAGIATFLLPPRWGATAVLVFPLQNDTSGLAALVTGTSNADPLKIFAGVLQSRTAAQLIGQSRDVNLPRETVQKAIEVQTDEPTNQLIIKASNKNKTEALNMCKEAIVVLGQLSANLNFSQSKKQADLTQAALNKHSNALSADEDQLVDSLKTFKSVPNPTNPLVNTDPIQKYKDAKFQLGQVNKALSVARSQAAKSARAEANNLPTQLPTAEWQSRLKEAEYQLRLQQIQFGPDSPQVQLAKQQVDETKQTLQQEISRTLKSVNTGVAPDIADLEARQMLLQWEVDQAKGPAESAPNESLELQRLLRKVGIETQVVQGLWQQYEGEKISADVDRVRWSVLEDAELEPAPVNKLYVRNCGIGLAIGLLFGLIGASRGRKRGTAAVSDEFVSQRASEAKV